MGFFSRFILSPVVGEGDARARRIFDRFVFNERLRIAEVSPDAEPWVFRAREFVRQQMASGTELHFTDEVCKQYELGNVLVLGEFTARTAHRNESMYYLVELAPNMEIDFADIVESIPTEFELESPWDSATLRRHTLEFTQPFTQYSARIDATRRSNDRRASPQPAQVRENSKVKFVLSMIILAVILLIVYVLATW